MKRKLFSVLALLATVLMSGNVWADDLKVTWAMGDSKDGVAAQAEDASGITFTAGSNFTVLDAAKTWNGIVFTQLQPSTSNKGNNGRSNIKDDLLNRYAVFSFKPAREYTPTKVSFDIIKIGTGDPTICVDFIDAAGNTLQVADNVAIRRNNDEDTTPFTQEITITGAKAGEGAVALRIYVGKLANNKQVGIANVVIEGTIAAAAPAHTHSYATEWSSDEKGHWHACTGEGECDAPKADEAAHEYGKEGAARYTCTVCAYADETKKAEAEAADGEAAVENVIAKIAAIDSVTYTAECKAKIDAARAAYDALEKAQQAEVTNYEDLEAAEAKYAELKKAAAEADYTVTVKKDTEDAENWVITPSEAKPGTTVTFKYKGAKQIKSIKIIKK